MLSRHTEYGQYMLFMLYIKLLTFVPQARAIIVAATLEMMRARLWEGSVSPMFDVLMFDGI